jgi:Mg/Co/Ni transporter MgtE
MENSKSNQHSATNDKVLEAVNQLSDRVDRLADKTDKQFDDVLDVVNIFATETRQEFISIRQEMATKKDLAGFATKDDLAGFATKEDLVDLESKMTTRFVTKDYLDEKLADQTSEIFIRLDRRQDKDRNFKKKLVGIISGHSLISKKESDDLRELI